MADKDEVEPAEGPTPAEPASPDVSDRVAEPTNAELTRAAESEEAGDPASAAKRPPKKKVAPTSRRDHVDKPERTTPAKFVGQSVGELRKVIYPTGPQLMNYFVVVLVFVLFVIAYVSLLDLGLGQLIFKIFS